MLREYKSQINKQNTNCVWKQQKKNIQNKMQRLFFNVTMERRKYGTSKNLKKQARPSSYKCNLKPIELPVGFLKWVRNTPDTNKYNIRMDGDCEKSLNG